MDETFHRSPPPLPRQKTDHGAVKRTQMPGGRKVSYVIGGMGKKPDTNFKNVSAGKFTRHKRILRAKGGMSLREYLAKHYNYPL